MDLLYNKWPKVQIRPSTLAQSLDWTLIFFPLETCYCNFDSIWTLSKQKPKPTLKPSLLDSWGPPFLSDTSSLLSLLLTNNSQNPNYSWKQTLIFISFEINDHHLSCFSFDSIIAHEWLREKATNRRWRLVIINSIIFIFSKTSLKGDTKRWKMLPMWYSKGVMDILDRFKPRPEILWMPKL